MYTYFYLDNGSLWKKIQCPKNKWICWKRVEDTEISFLQKKKVDINKYIAPIGMKDKIGKQVIYTSGYPYDYMTLQEKISNGYIESKCCKIGNSCGNVQLRKNKTITSLRNKSKFFVN